jgi:hypothetical protein
VRWSGVASVVFCLLAALPAKAKDDKPDPRDAAAIQQCIKVKTGRNWARENCIGIVSEPCIKDEMAKPPSEIMACFERERVVWDSILNDACAESSTTSRCDARDVARLDYIARQELRLHL